MRSADLNFASGTLLVEYDPAEDPLAAVVRTVEASGHGIQTLEAVAAGEPETERPWIDRYRAEIATAGSGFFSAVAFAFGLAGAELAATVAYAVAIGFGGLLVWRRALVSLRARMLDMNVLMSLAVIGAVALGEWGEGATVFFLFALGGLLESRSLERTRRSIRDLMDLTPPNARVERGGAWIELPVTEVRPGDVLQVRPGERIPVDGIVKSGHTAVDEAPITGESVPADRQPGDTVFGGTLNTTGLVEVTATAATADSTLARIVHLVEEAQASRAPSQAFIDRFSRYYTPTVIALAVAIAVVPILLGSLLGADWGPPSEWIRRALVMLVVSCPCALVISTPVSIVSGITRASRDGVLVKGGAFLEAASRIGAIAFDKTGTLTEGRPEVAEVVVLDGVSDNEVLAIAAALESHSNHPLAKAVVRAAGENMRPATVRDYAEMPGRGVSGVIDGDRWEVCSRTCAEDLSAPWTAEQSATVDGVESRGHTVLALLRQDTLVGVVGVADVVRADAPEAIGRLRALGVEHLVMLTGDNEKVGQAVTEAAGLTGFLARLLPAGKTDAIRVLQERYGTVAMVGDGINDAPALAAADVGIAMGAAGSDTALEAADVALMRDDLTALPGFIALGRRTMRTIVVNVVVSIAIKAVFLVLALTGYATLWMAVFADTGVSLLVILNSMRLLRAGSERVKANRT